MPITELPTINLILAAPKNTETIVVSSESAIWQEFLTLQISPATKRSYAATLKDFFRREFDLPVSPETIEQFLSCTEYQGLTHVLAYRAKLIASGLAAATINARLAGIRAFVAHAAKRGLCAFRLNDIKSVKSQPYRDTKGISIEQFQSLIDTIDRSSPSGKRDYAIMRLLWDNALRRAELCGLDQADFRRSEGRLFIKGKGMIDRELIDLAPATVYAIADWLQSQGETSCPALFTSGLDTRYSADLLYRMVRQLGVSAGLDRDISPHRIRHSSITALLDLNGGNVREAQAHSRHKNLSTLILYDDSRQQLQGKSARMLADAIL